MYHFAVVAFLDRAEGANVQRISGSVALKQLKETVGKRFTPYDSRATEALHT